MGTVATMIVAYLMLIATDSVSDTPTPVDIPPKLFCRRISRSTTCRGYISLSRRIADAQNQLF